MIFYNLGKLDETEVKLQKSEKEAKKFKKISELLFDN